ncbi:primosomal replication protein N [Methyloversatilis universalis]|uniref:primosomal replication protein N n=1 Tax=Methyloversatilis universalis TaxID=378211 RepID=UPI0003632942|nr:primosomal replication protein N [Methyloversatilis universalis]
MTEGQGATSPATNSFTLAATLIERDALRQTPAGVPILRGCLEHFSQQIENGAPREVRFETDFVLLGDLARLLAQAPLGTSLIAQGFMAARSAKSRQGVMHINSIEFVTSGS